MAPTAVDLETRYRELEAEWGRTADRWLPARPEPGGTWRSSGPVPLDLPRQGWKLHVSATILSAGAVLAAVGPALHARGLHFKGPVDLVTLKRLNCGLFHGYSQVGKCVTVYPRSADESASVAAQLHGLTAGLAGPAVPFERPFAPGSLVHARYGAFRADAHAPADTVVGPDGTPQPDDRSRTPDWATPPPALWADDARPVRAPGPLGTTYRAYAAVSQRGKGGVYRALDLSGGRARLCAVKEGRRHGEVDVDGSDGRDRVLREAEVLRDLQGTSLRPPRLRTVFEEGGHAYVVMEWVDGEPLQTLLAPGADPLPADRVLLLARACASVVDRLHARGWAWRDLKPANLVLDRGVLRPLDFEGTTAFGAWLEAPWGSPGYLPPEWRRPGPATSAQDRYALGATLRQLATGVVLGDAEPPPLETARPDLPAAYGALIAALQADDPRARPSARSAVLALGRMRDG